jgi:Tfp pilus assembly protein FimT
MEKRKITKFCAFTLVDLIVVITILAILWIIAFVSLQSYSKNARDVKRVNDIKSLETKIVIESAKWVSMLNLIEMETTTLVIINNSGTISTIWVANFENLH